MLIHTTVYYPSRCLYGAARVHSVCYAKSPLTVQTDMDVSPVVGCCHLLHQRHEIGLFSSQKAAAYYTIVRVIKTK